MEKVLKSLLSIASFRKKKRKKQVLSSSGSVTVLPTDIKMLSFRSYSVHIILL